MSLNLRSILCGSAVFLAAALAVPSSAIAQQKGYRPLPADSAQGSPRWDFYEALGGTFRNQHALDRAARYWDWLAGDRSILLRAAAQAATTYDSSTSWTGKNCVTPVKDQGNCLSCWAFASAAVMESAYCIEDGLRRDSAEQSLLECRAVAAVADRCGTGNNLGEAFDIMRRNGVDQESRRAYNTTTFSTCTGAKIGQVFYGIDAVQFLSIPAGSTQPAIDDIKRAIIDAGAVTVALEVTAKFNNYAAGTPIVTTAQDLQTPLGGHVVTIVGWSDTLGAWRIKNSWGTTTGWGARDGGFAWLTYNDLAVQPSSYAYVTPQNKTYDWATATRLFAEFALKISVNPPIWVQNPLVQFPTSLGFPKRRQTVIEGVQWAIDNSLLSRALVATWPQSVRDRLH